MLGLVAREIDYLWGRLARASRTLENVAPIWSRGGDPRVVRLVESAAYLFGRIREKLDDDAPEIVHPIVASALPEMLRATPSVTIVRLVDPAERRRDVIAYPSIELESRPIDGATCLFRSSWPVLAAPVTIDRTTLRMPEPGVQVLSLRLSIHGGAAFMRAFPEPLRVFVDDPNVFRALDVVQGLCSARGGIELRAWGAQGEPLGSRTVPAAALRPAALDGPFRLFPGRTDRFASGSLLRAFHTAPEVFAFFDLVGVRDAVGAAFPRAQTIEISVALGSKVEDGDVACVLDCTPAVNVFEASSSIRVTGAGNLGLLQTPSHPGAELFDLRSARLQPARNRTGEIAVRLWESEPATELWDDELYLVVGRRAAVDRGSTEVSLSLMQPRGAGKVPAGDLLLEFLASDGLRTETLLRGDVGRRTDLLQAQNITRVTRPFAPQLDRQLPWRLNAYARMPAASFSSVSALGAYVQLHDPREGRTADGASANGFLGAARRGTYRVHRDEVIHGDDVDIELDETVWGGRGAAWLLGEIAARAIAERAELLRFTRVRWMRGDQVVADYGRRTGERLPTPLG